MMMVMLIRGRKGLIVRPLPRSRILVVVVPVMIMRHIVPRLMLMPVLVRVGMIKHIARGNRPQREPCEDAEHQQPCRNLSHFCFFLVSHRLFASRFGKAAFEGALAEVSRALLPSSSQRVTSSGWHWADWIWRFFSAAGWADQL
jgi:hypothetical protein